MTDWPGFYLGRLNRVQVEADILSAALCQSPFRLRVRASLTTADFATWAHRALWRRLADPVDPLAVDDAIAAALGCSIETAHQWRMGTNPVDPDAEMAWLIEHR